MDLPRDAADLARCEQIFDGIVQEEGQTVLGWRDVPTDNKTLGATAKAAEPFMRQVFIGRSSKLADDLAFERKLYVIRKRAEQAIRYGSQSNKWFYISSLSYKTLIYKGMLMPEQVEQYYPDLRHPAMDT